MHQQSSRLCAVEESGQNQEHDENEAPETLKDLDATPTVTYDLPKYTHLPHSNRAGAKAKSLASS
jgi:hypothetical protein